VPSVLNASSRVKEFCSLVSSLSCIFLESTDIATLKNCCSSIAVLASGDHARSDDALLALIEVIGKLRTHLFDLFSKKAKLGEVSPADAADDDESMETGADLDMSISLCLCRLSIVAKRWCIADLFGDNESKDADLDDIGEAVAKYLDAELLLRQPRMKTVDGEEILEAAEAMAKIDETTHIAVANSVSAGMELLLCLMAWRLKEEIQKIDDGEAESGDEYVRNHVAVRLRDRLLNLFVNCYEHYISPNELKHVTGVHSKFSVAVQEYALKVSGDLRSLCPRKWIEARSPFLVACAIADDSKLAGSSNRFVRSQSARVSCGAS
jgi:hypothetical protein